MTDALADAIAVVGLGVRAPGAPNASALWRALCGGRDLVTRFDFASRQTASYLSSPASLDGWVGAAGILDDPYAFDASFFGYSPREAACLDPQHRILLEVAFEALESSGHDPARLDGRTVGVFAGCGAPSYLLHLAQVPELADLMGPHALLVGNDKDFLATRIAYHLGLTGPTMSVQTACSTSLVAIHLACQSLLARECDLAVAGGVAIQTPPRAGYRDVPGSIFSPDGFCRPFDARANGTVPSSGAVAVVLERWEDARRARDTVYALVRGTATNNDGPTRVGFTAPGVAGQVAVLTEALTVSGLTPDRVSYIEAHGTGTALGDPIEVAAIRRVYGDDARGHPCALGSIKSNLGHTDAAAGAFGFAKLCLMLRERALVPSVHFERPNPSLAIDGTRFFVNTEHRAWPAKGGELRCGAVSSFGLGGANAHAVLTEAPPIPATESARSIYVWKVSGRDAASASERANALAAELAGDAAGATVADVAFTLANGRREMAYRIAIVAEGRDEAARRLRDAAHRPVRADEPRIALVFPGQGTQYEGMGRTLYGCDPIFREAIDRCADATRYRLGKDLRALIGCRGELVPHSLDRTVHAQPAIFAVSYAYATRLLAAGVKPDVMVGHSVGELVAVTIAGGFSLDDALSLVVARAHLMQAMPRGSMAIVIAPAEEVEDALVRGVEIAALNGREATVIAGPSAAVEVTVGLLRGAGITASLLRTSHAFHSQAMEPAAREFAEEAARVGARPLEVPVASTCTATAWQPGEKIDPAYWGTQLRQRVDLVSALRSATEPGPTVLVDIGPHASLISPDDATGLVHLATGPRDEARAVEVFGRALAELSVRGPIDLGAYGGPEGRRIPLPTYPFARTHCFIQAGSVPRERVPGVVNESSLAEPAREPASVEDVVRATWISLLGVSEVLGTDDFFALGGHSLYATRLIARVRRELAVDLPLRSVFEHPTFDAMCLAVRRARRIAAYAPVTRGGADDGPLSSAQRGVWFMQRLLPHDPAYNVHLALRITGALCARSLEAAWHAALRRHDALRTGFAEQDGEPTQFVVRLEARPDIERIAAPCPCEDEEAWVRAQARAHARTPFDLARPPLARLSLLEVGVDDHVALITVHHLVVDGWSIGQLAAEVARDYRRALAREPLDDAPAPLRYVDYARWERAWLSTDAARAEADYWRRALAGAAPAALCERPPGAQTPTSGGRISRRWSKETRAALERCGRSEAGSLHTAAAALVGILSSAFTRRDDVVVATDVANRPRPELESMVGFFVNQIVLRFDLAGARSFEDAVRCARRATFDAFEHQDLPFEHVVAAVAPRRTERVPLFHVKLVLHRDPSAHIELPDLRVEPIDVFNDTAKFDLAVNLVDRTDGLELQLEYAHRFYSDARAIRLADQLTALAECVTRDRRAPVASMVELVREMEQRAVEERARSAKHGLRAALARRITEDSH